MPDQLQTGSIETPPPAAIVAGAAKPLTVSDVLQPHTSPPPNARAAQTGVSTIPSPPAADLPAIGPDLAQTGADASLSSGKAIRLGDELYGADDGAGGSPATDQPAGSRSPDAPGPDRRTHCAGHADNNKQPQQKRAAELERIVLSSALLSADSLRVIAESTRSDDFSTLPNVTIHAKMIEMFQEGSLVDRNTLLPALHISGELGKTGGEDYVRSLESIVDFGDLTTHINCLREYNVNRKFVAFGDKTRGAATQGTRSQDLLAQAESDLQSIAECINRKRWPAPVPFPRHPIDAMDPNLLPGFLGKLYRLKDWGSKLPGAVARIAGVIHCVVSDPTETVVITEDTMERSLNLAAALIDHALAVFDLMERDTEVENAEKILSWIRKQGLDTFTVRACFCAQQSRFKRVDNIHPSLRLLEEHGYIRPRPKAAVSHRPSDIYDVNPEVLEASV